MTGKIIDLDEYRERLKKKETRVAWDNFPPVFILCPLGAAKNNLNYGMAKQKGRNYAILDDTLSMGGTLASLRGYIENKGGNVILAIALTGRDGAASLNIKEAMLTAILNKHGDELDEWWKTEIGFGVDKLTQGEAGHLKKAPSIEEIRNRITANRPKK